MVAGVVIPPHLIPIKASAIQTPNAEGSNTTTILRQAKESIEIGQRLRGNVGDSYVRVSELVGLGLATIVNGTVQLANGGQPGQLPTLPGTGGGTTGGGGGGGGGSTGATGATGAQGPPGEDGSDGEDGMSIIGPAGPAGADGASGSGVPIVLYPDDPDDPREIPGAPGPSGASGAAGPAGPSGTFPFYLWPDDPDDVLPIPGAAGAPGATGGGTAVPNGMNLVPPAILTGGATGSWSNYTVLAKIGGASLLRYANNWQFNFNVASGTAVIGAAVVMKVAVGTTTPVLSNTPVTWGGNPTPSLTAGQNLCDEISVAITPAYDYYIAVWLPVGASNAAVNLSNATGLGSTPVSLLGGYAAGNNTTAPSAPYSTGLYAITEVVTDNDTTASIPGATGAAGPVGVPAWLTDDDPEDASIWQRPYETKVLSGKTTVTGTGLTTTQTGVLQWWVEGTWLMMLIPGVTGTSNSTAFTLTYTAGTIPFPKQTSQWWPVATFEDGGGATGNFSAQISADGTIQFLKNLSSAGFTSSGTKGVSSQFVMMQSLI